MSWLNRFGDWARDRRMHRISRSAVLPPARDWYDEFDRALVGTRDEPACHGGEFPMPAQRHILMVDPPMPQSSPEYSTDIPCDGPATIVGVFATSHGGFSAPVCAAHWQWATEHWVHDFSQPIAVRSATGVWERSGP
jgi:hypothetical protein